MRAASQLKEECLINHDLKITLNLKLIFYATPIFGTILQGIINYAARAPPAQRLSLC